MRRGDVVWVDFDPARAGEANQRRPAVIVSNDGANRNADRLGRGIVTVVPVTSKIEHVYRFQVLLPSNRCNLAHDSKAQAEQIRSVAFDRIGAVVGQLPVDLLAELDRALRLHLAL